MKRILLSFSLLTLLGTVVVSCSKNTEEELECEIDVASVAGKYRLVSAKLLEGNRETDVLNDIYESCELDDINELKADKTFTYTDAGTSCSPSGTVSGTWDITGRTLRLNSGLSNIESFNCKELVVTYRNGSDLIKETYRKL